MINTQTIVTRIRSNSLHILLWSIAVVYLFVAPSLHNQLFVQEGKPIELDELPTEETGGIRYNIEAVKFWSENMQVHDEVETYALWGWAFLDTGETLFLKDFDRFFLISNQEDTYVFKSKVFPRPGVQDVFKDLGLDDLSSSGIYAVISRNEIPIGKYNIGLLFENKSGGEQYFVVTNKELIRTPNHLYMEEPDSN